MLCSSFNVPIPRSVCSLNAVQIVLVVKSLLYLLFIQLFLYLSLCTCSCTRGPIDRCVHFTCTNFISCLYCTHIQIQKHLRLQALQVHIKALALPCCTIQSTFESGSDKIQYLFNSAPFQFQYWSLYKKWKKEYSNNLQRSDSKSEQLYLAKWHR